MSLSVIIPTYNHAHFLPECLDSIVQQELQAFEILVIDDASTDNTREVVESYRAKHPQIKYIKNEKNLKPARSINLALSIAKGEYIVGSAADDFLLPGFFQKGVEFLDSQKELAFCCGDTFHFYGEKPYHFQFLKTLALDQTKIFDSSKIQNLFRKENFVIQSHACMYRKDRLIEAGGFNPELQSLCDWYLNVFLALKWGFGYLPHAFAAYRLTPGSYANAVLQNREARKKTLSALFNILDQPDNSSIKKGFKEGLLFSQINYPYFMDFIREPKYWSLTFPSFPKKIQNMAHKKIGRIFSFFQNHP